MNNSIDRRIRTLEKKASAQMISNDILAAVDITQHIAPVYSVLHQDIIQGVHSVYNLPGGRGSCKSSFVSLEIVNGIMQDSSPNSNAIVFRRWAAAMRESVYSQIAWAIDILGVGELWRGTVSPMCYTYLPTGSQILFRGLDDPSKLKSIKPAHGVFRYVWFEEFSELAGEKFYRNVLQSAVRGGDDFVIFRSFNPPLSVSNWANQIILQADERAVTLHTSYLDIPPEWLGELFLHEAERLQTVNEKAYRHEYLGEAVGAGGEVFENVITREITDDEISRMQYIYQGIDWGFAVDPAAFIRCAYDKKTDTVFIIDEIYQTKLSNARLAELIKQKGYDKGGSMMRYGIDNRPYTYTDKQLITADCAEPKSIADLQSAGLRVVGCTKYAGCVEYRISWLQHRKIVIDPKRTPNAHREFTTYEYQKTRDGAFISAFPDKDNHTIDALAYALEGLIKRRGVSA